MPQLSGGLRWLCCCDEQSNRAACSNRPADCSSRQAVQPSSLFDAVGYRRLSDESKRRQTISVKQFRWNNFSEIRVSTFKFSNQRARCSEFEDREGIETEDRVWGSKLGIETEDQRRTVAVIEKEKVYQKASEKHLIRSARKYLDSRRFPRRLESQ